MKRKPVHTKNDGTFNLYHPDIKHEIEYAWTAGGVKYYNFKQDSKMRYGRYVILQAFLQEYYLRVDLKTLQANITKLEKWLNPVIDKNGTGQLEIGKCLELLSIMRQRSEIAFEPDTVFRLASCLFFDDKEILSDYDREYNEKKIARWRESDTVDFFFHRLFQELTHLTVSSREGLISYLKTAPELLKGWHTMEDILSR